MNARLNRLTRLAADLAQWRTQHAVTPETLFRKDTEAIGLETPDLELSDWQPVANGSLWGGPDAHAWFRFEHRVTAEQAGKPLLLVVRTGREGQWDACNPQMLAYCDGRLLQGLDVNHTEAMLTAGSPEGTRFAVALRAYAGLSPEQPVIRVSVAVHHADVEGLLYDIKVPCDAWNALPETEYRRDTMLETLNGALRGLDLRKPFSPEFHASIALTRSRVESEFYATLPQDGPIATCVGHTHIDVAWLWRIRQTREKAVRSFSTVLALMDRFPAYTFMSSQPQLYEYVKEDAPEVYARIRERIAEGRWEAEGGMWLEADCNLASGESLVRQFVHGKRFFREEFGVDNHVLWLPDVFGYSAALPQIMQKSGIDSFMTIKIGWNDTNRMPHDTFTWRGLDGTGVLTHFITTQDHDSTSHGTTYVGMQNASQTRGAWNRYADKTLNDDVLICYGHGDGGGGPTAEMVENSLRMSRGLPGIPRVRMGHAGPWFRRLADTVRGNPRLPEWCGELYLEYHRGTYTGMARNKKYNRKGEKLLGAVENAATAASLLTGAAYPEAALHRHWRTLLLNQFHDILPGSSIREVYEDSKSEYETMQAGLQALLQEARGAVATRIALPGLSVVVFNDTGFARNDIARFAVPGGMAVISVRDADGSRVAFQVEGGMAAFVAEGVPAKGWKRYGLELAAAAGDAAPQQHDTPACRQADGLTVSPARMENGRFLLELDGAGQIVRLYDKQADREVLAPGSVGNALTAYEDRPLNFDAWDVDPFYGERSWPVDHTESIAAMQIGPVYGRLRITRRYQESRIMQDIVMYRDLARIDFETEIDWKENQTLLKTAFPLDIHSARATYDIQFGNVERPTHANTSWDEARFEVCAHQWADLSEGGYGVSLLNDCKYGHDIHGNTMRLTLLKSGTNPNPVADQELHRFTYSLLPHTEGWQQAETAREAASLNDPLRTVIAGPQEGTLPDCWGFVATRSRNILPETVKRADDGDGYIVRFHEFENRRGPVTLAFGQTPSAVWECDLLENNLEAVPVSGDAVTLAVRPYDIRTLRVRF